MADTHVTHTEEHDPTVHHEDRDVDVRAILWFAAIFVVGAIVMHVALWYLLKGFKVYEAHRPVEMVTEIPLSPERQIPPEPRLQPFPEPLPLAAVGAGEESRNRQEHEALEQNFVNPWDVTPAADWAQYKAAYDEKLHAYGWIDQRSGIAHIPIEDAKRRLLAQGLPARPANFAATPATNAEVVMPTPITGDAGYVDANEPSYPENGMTSAPVTGEGAATATVEPSP